MTSRFLHLGTSLAVCACLAACGGSSSKDMEMEEPNPQTETEEPNPPTEMEEPNPQTEMGEPNPPTDLFINAARMLTGVSDPTETAEAHAEGVTARLAALRTKFDAGEEVFLVRSDTFGEINGVDNTVVFTCNNTCSYLDGNGNTVDVEADDILTTLAAYEGPLPVLTRSDLTTSFYGGDNKVYGAWMEHGAFFVDASPGTTARTERYAVALGASTGEAPAVVGTWTGLMVGTPQRGNNKGDILQGDATLEYTPDDNTSIQGILGSLNVSFTGIKNIDTPSHAVPDISIENVHVTASGEYSVHAKIGDERQFIEGDFMGTDHAETAGVFEHSGIVGAFGARKQPDSD